MLIKKHVEVQLYHVGLLQSIFLCVILYPDLPFINVVLFQEANISLNWNVRVYIPLANLYTSFPWL